MNQNKFSELVARNANLAGRFRGYVHHRNIHKWNLDEDTFAVVIHMNKSSSHCTLWAKKNGVTYYLDSCPIDYLPNAVNLPFSLQHHRTRVCAIYTLYFAGGLFGGDNLLNLLRVFSHNQLSNDICMIEWFRAVVSPDINNYFDRRLLPKVHFKHFK